MTLRACWMVFLLICITQILDLENEEMTVEFKHCSSTNFSLPASEPLKKMKEKNPMYFPQYTDFSYLIFPFALRWPTGSSGLEREDFQREGEGLGLFSCSWHWEEGTIAELRTRSPKNGAQWSIVPFFYDCFFYVGSDYTCRTACGSQRKVFVGCCL